MASWSAISRRIRVPLGFLFAVLYVWLARPDVQFMIAGAVLIIAGLGIRALASGHVKKNEQLTMTGPYAYTRNPLYLGSLLLAIGFIVAAKSWWIAGVAIIFFFAVYLPVIFSEEKFLREKFPEFESYAASVPRLLPRFSRGQNTQGSFSWDLYRKHREYNALLGALAILAVLIAKMYWHYH